jgi:hypothetical protein
MTCQECEFALGCDQTSAAIAEHLRECPACHQLFEDLRANAEAFESMSAEEMPRIGVQVGRPVLPAAIGAVAVAAAAAVAILFVAPVREEKLPPVHYALTPMKFEIPDMRPSAPQRRGAVPKPAPATLPLMVKMLTDDPNVVIYWQIDADQEGMDK